MINMITKMKLLLCVFPLILTGCAGYDLAGLIGGESTPKSDNCLLYTSDAADE